MLGVRPPLSIIIPTHQKPERFRVCLQSVLRFAPSDAEIIVIDDGSPDAQASKVCREYGRVRLYRQETAKGFCCSINQGIRLAQAKIIELLNDDTEVTKNWFAQPLQWFDDPQIASVAPLVLLRESRHAEQPRIDSAGDVYFRGGYAKKRGYRECVQPQFLQPQLVDSASGSAAFYRKEALLQIGLFPEHFVSYFEDVDVGLSLRSKGYLCAFEPRSRVWHDGGGTHPPSDELLMQQSRNEELLFLRHGHWQDWPAHLGVLAGKSIRRIREGTFRPFLRGRMQAWTRKSA